MAFKAVDPHRASIPEGDNGRVAYEQINQMLAEVYSTNSAQASSIATITTSVTTLTTSVTTLTASVASLLTSVSSLSNTVNKIIAFKASKRGATSDNQVSLTHQVYTKITYAQEFFDSGSCYDTTTSRFTPGVAALVLMSAQTWLSSNVVSVGPANIVTKVWKNGQATEIGTGIGFTPAGFTGTGCCQVPGTYDMAASTDYYEAYQYGEYFGGTNVGEIDANPAHTWFSGHVVKVI